MASKLTQKIVSALSYFSILFFPVLFPLIVWIVAKSQGLTEVKSHAAKAFWSQIIPLIFTLFGLFALGTISFHGFDHLGGLSLILIALIALLSLGLFIYDIAMGIIVLLDHTEQE